MERTIVEILQLSDGRDKLLKTAQYTLKTILWGLSFKQKKNKELEKACNGLQKTLSDGRRLFRIGNWINVCKEVSNGRDMKKNLFLSLVAYLSTIFSLITTCCDDSSWFLKFSGSSEYHKKISETGDKGWAGSTFLDLIPITVNLFHNYQTAARIKNSQNGEKVEGEDLTSKELKRLYTERWMLLVNEVKLLSDLPIAMTYGWNLKTDPGIIALCGMVSSICGLYKIWVKVRKT